MREILFRGKNKLSGGWCEGYLVKTGDHFRISTQNDLISFGVDPKTVGQYTGLKDRNDKKIFEGDFVRGKDNLEKVLEVCGYISHENGSFVIVGEFMTHYRWLDYDVELIGNIYDNPELLEQ